MTSPVNVGVFRLITVLLILTFTQMISFAQTFTEVGFSTETVAQVTRFNTVGFTFAPDGRIFTWEKPGVVRIVKNGVLLATPFLDIRSRVYSDVDSGLIGLALDPNFASNGFVYLLYTFEDGATPGVGAKTARLTRVKADPNNPDLVQANSEVILMGKIGTPPCSNSPVGADCMGSDSGAHTVGTVRFGSDGKIYVGMGDGSPFNIESELSFRSQDLNYYNGKILRINPDGTAPGDNPFYDGNPNSVRSKVYAYGLRSPFRFTNKPATSEVYIGDVGAAKFEEINRGRGANFGWPCYEGPNPQFSFNNKFPQRCAQIAASSVTFPIHSYPWNGGSSIVMGPFYTGTKYPAKFRNNLFFADFVQGFIRRAVFDASNNISSVESVATGVDTPVHLEQGADGNLYYLALAVGEIKRIRFSGSAPAATATAIRPSASTPYTVAFSSAGSSDPNGSALTYQWDFGDGATSTSANPTHTYSGTGVKTFTVTLTVTNALGLSSGSTIAVVVGGRLPVATITAPANNVRIKTGTQLTFTGTASDPDETLSNTAMKWSVLLHHNEHIHPGVTATGSSGSFVVEDHGSAGETFFYEIVLTVTDSAGLTDTKRVNVIPESPAPPPVTTLPVPWLGKDVGSVGKIGSNSFSNGSFTLQGSGTDIGGTNDSFNYVYQTLQGDGQIVARIASIQNTAAEAKTGVMIRESLAANSRYVMVRYKSNEHTASLRRANPGEATITNLGDEQILQRWQRIVRQGNQFSTYQSADGTNWLLIETVTVNMPSSVLFGVAVTAANNTVLCRTVVDNVKVNSIAVNRPPTASLTAPTNNSTVTAPATIALKANAADADGSISKVEFYQGGLLINSDQSAPYEYTLTLGSAGTSSFTARAYDNNGAVTTSSPVQVNVVAPVNGTGSGLKGEYFKREDFRELKLTRTDSFINFDWGKDKPIEGLDKDHFSVRWTGFVQPRFSGTQTFYVSATDTVRLWVNGQLIINKSGNILTENRGAISLDAGKKYTLKLEFVEKDKTASVKLEWSSPNQAKEVIPRSQLYLQ